MKRTLLILPAALLPAVVLPLHAQWPDLTPLPEPAVSGSLPQVGEVIDGFIPPVPKEFTKEVAEAPVQARAVAPRAGERGANLVMELVAPPVSTGTTASSTTAKPVPVRPWTAEEREARRSAAPDHILLFSPTVTLSGSGMSRVAWSATLPDPAGGPPRFEDYIVWVPVNLESIRAVGDLSVGKTRWLLTPSLIKARSPQTAANPDGGPAKPVPVNHQSSTINIPKWEDFKGPGGSAGAILVEKGNPDLIEALEPVMALTAKYQDPAESARIAEDFAKMTAIQAAAEAWAREHPEPVRDTVIKFWPLESTEYPTAGAAATAGPITGPAASALPAPVK